MVDYLGFRQGATQYPLPAAGAGIGGIGATLLRDADASLFYLLEFYASVLNTHLAGRFLAEAASSRADDIITGIVAQTLPLNPEPYLIEEHLGFPLLAAYRKNTKVEYLGNVKLKVDEFDVAYVLPPLQAGEAERLLPILSAVYDVIDNRTEQGMDPSYTPTSPTGTAGESVWTRAGVAVAEVKGATYGGYQPADKFFPAVILHLELKSKSDFALTEFLDSDGQDVEIALSDPAIPPAVPHFIDLAIDPP